MKKTSLFIYFIVALLLLAGCSSSTNTLPTGIPRITDSPDPNTRGYGNKIKGDILFNNLPWGTTREEVYSILKQLFPNIEERKCEEKEYGKQKK